MSVIYEDAMRGRQVIDSTGRVIGEVDAEVLDLASWKVDALRVKLQKEVTDELGTAHGRFHAARLDVPTDFIQNVGDAIVLKGPVASLRTVEQKIT